MHPNKKEHPKEKQGLHLRNKHRERYDFKALTASCPDLSPFVRLNDYQDESIDFSNPEAVLLLNKAILKLYYGINYWVIPKGYLCPPIPGRADYIHSVADLLATSNNGSIPQGATIKCLDIGVGANCIYPIIGSKEYGWSFVGSDIEAIAVKSASEIIAKNTGLKELVDIRQQKNTKHIFNGVIGASEQFDLTICNPPFHASFEEAQAGTLRKLSNLNGKRISKPNLNFGGRSNELWCEGGEQKFVEQMIAESKHFSTSCFWFSTLISKSSSLKSVYFALEKANALEIKTIPMSQGNKTSRIVAWTYLNKQQQQEWVKKRWNKG
jgi:23S rRNA (adenine1618-N6)-methyltransferase